MAGPPVRERYNAKARGSTAGGSHKKRKQKKPKAPVVVDEDGVPIPTGKRDEVMQEQSEDEGVYEGEGKGKMSSKKRKRLDSYINKKLKTEERLKTLKLLASLTPSASTSAALASTATLGQNPFMPSSAAERMDKKEDRLVRKGIHRLGKTADAESSDGSGDEVYEGRGKGRAVDVAIEIDREDAPAPMAQVTTDKGKKRSKLSKKASWNPNLLSTQPDSDSSSDFDSSASENDQSDIVEAGPSSPRACPPPRKLPIASARPLPSPAIAIAGSARDSQEVNIKGPAPAVKNAFAGALKKSADRQVVQPRVIQRRQKMPLGRLRTQPDDESDEENSVEDEEDSDDEDDDENGEDDDGESESDSGAEDSSEDGNEDEDQEEESQPKKKRSLGFKNWALQQMGRPGDPNNEDQTRSISPPPPPTDNKPKIPSARAPKTGEFVGPLGSKFEIPSTSLLTGNLPTKASSSSNAIPTVRRRPSIAESRMDLPILAEEQNIVEAIRMHPVVIIAGETGSGKTTQVPQMLYEAGFGYKTSDDPGMIAVTQPRRVAAVSLATRVKSELGFGPASSVVAHQIRYSSSTSPETCIKFMTDGVLLRELASDFLLSRYSVIIVDEAHERGVNTDVLIGVLSRVAKLRESKWRESQDKPAGDTDTKGSSTIRPLRIVIMSATLRIEDFAQNRSLFPTPPPVIHIPARQHPVTLHFSRKTTSDYVTEAYKKVCKIHARLPVGGILVFLTGQAEIQQLCRKLESKYGNKKGAGDGKQYTKKGKASLPIVQSVASTGDQVEAEDVDLGNDEDLAADVDDGDAVSDPEALDSDDDGDDDLDIDEASDAPMQILPLYSLLSNEQQMQVFDSPPEGHRMVIVATNVAETSLTIPGVRYVVDSGRSKERHYDSSSGVQTFQVSWISKASASQRAGRAGRTGPGHCYRLYSSALFEDHFAKFAQPEIMRMPIEGVVLQMKSMNIDQVVNFPFPTPPDRQQLSIAERLLTNLGALEKAAITRMVGGAQIVGSEGGRITDLGKAMAGYPVTPRFAKMLVIGNQHECLAYVIAIVACLSVGDPFLHELSIDEGNDSADDEENETVGASRKAELLGIRSEELRKKEERKDLRKRYFNAHAQFMGLGNGTSDMFKMLAAVGAYEHEPTFDFCTRHFLRPKAMQEIQQLRHQIANIMKMPSSKLTPPTDNQMKVLRQVMTASSLDRIAVRQDVFLKKTTTFSSTRGVPYRAIGLGKEEIFIHPSSSLFHKAPPEFLTYHETTRNVNSGKTWMKCITKINPSWLSTLGKGMCTYSKPAEVPKISSSKSKSKVEEVRQGEREVVVVPHFADLGVDLPPVRMKQKRIGTRWVLSE